MSADLAAHWAYLENEWGAAQAAPLSLRKTRLVIGLIDAFVDRLFVSLNDDGDVLAFRAEQARRSPALGQMLALASGWIDGPQLQVQAVSVPPSEMGQLAVEDFMVSLYNAHSVQRIMIVTDRAELAHRVIGSAMTALRKQLPP